MQHIGLDLAKTASQLCILTEDGELIERRIATTREHFARLLATAAPARILIEASTESEWVARYLESLGHEVIVADPNFAPMSATRSRRVKTDKRKAGPNRARDLLVEAAWALIRSSRAEAAALRQWAMTIRERRGMKVAIVALARKLAGILYAMWREATDLRAQPARPRAALVA